MKKFTVLVLAMLMVLGMATAAFAADTNDDYNHGTPVLTSPISPDLKAALPTTDAAQDNSLNNANDSGVGVGGQTANFSGVIKSDNMTWIDTQGGGEKVNQTQLTHGAYQNNTNSCASCHQTHTGAADNLLFKSSVYNTCTACHDGTLGFYNVFAQGAQASSAGTFGGNAAGNASMHLSNDTVEIKFAPGGDTSGTKEGGWTQKFSCNSCHTPHGSYSDRLLHFNPNHMADVVAEEGGNKVVSQVYMGLSSLPIAHESVSYVVYDTYANITALDVIGPFAKANNALFNGKASATVKAANNLMVVVTAVENSDHTFTYKVDTTPWFYEYEFDAAHANRYYSATFFAQQISEFANGEYPTLADLYNASGDLMAFQPSTAATPVPAIRFDFNNAFAYGPLTVNLGRSTDAWYNPGVTLKTAAIGRVIVADVPVRYTVTDPASGFTYGATEPLFYSKSRYDGTAATGNITPGTGISVSKFCAACHTDYFNNSTDDVGTGMFTSAYRHTTTSDSYMCLRCHFAHGADVTVMTDAMNRGLYKAGDDGKTAIQFMGTEAKALEYLKDGNPSSALKRYTNQAVCWRCHTSSHSAGFRNTDYFKNIGFTGGTITNMTKGDANQSAIPNGF